MKLTSYLVFNGQAEEAANFYADMLGGKIENLHRYESMPPMEGMPPVPEDWKQKVLHCSIGFSGGAVWMADSMPHDKRDFGNKGHMITIDCDSIAQAEAVYAKLIVGAQSIDCELGESFFAKRYAEVVDKFGVLWAVYFCENS